MANTAHPYARFIVAQLCVSAFVAFAGFVALAQDRPIASSRPAESRPESGPAISDSLRKKWVAGAEWKVKVEHVEEFEPTSPQSRPADKVLRAYTVVIRCAGEVEYKEKRRGIQFDFSAGNDAPESTQQAHAYLIIDIETGEVAPVKPNSATMRSTRFFTFAGGRVCAVNTAADLPIEWVFDRQCLAEPERARTGTADVLELPEDAAFKNKYLERTFGTSPRHLPFAMFRDFKINAGDDLKKTRRSKSVEICQEWDPSFGWWSFSVVRAGDLTRRSKIIPK